MNMRAGAIQESMAVAVGVGMRVREGGWLGVKEVEV